MLAEYLLLNSDVIQLIISNANMLVWDEALIAIGKSEKPNALIKCITNCHKGTTNPGPILTRIVKECSRIKFIYEQLEDKK